VHDTKLVLFKFCLEKPLNKDTGGGGPESNMHLLPYLLHMVLLNMTRAVPRESKDSDLLPFCFVPRGPCTDVLLIFCFSR